MNDGNKTRGGRHGARCFFNSRALGVRNAQGHVAEWPGARAAELTTANREIEALASSLSHDLRAPLRAIDGYSQALLEDYGDHLDARGRGYLERVRAAAEHMGRLIDGMLRLSQLTRAAIHRQSVDLGRLVRNTIDELRHSDPERNVDLEIAPGAVALGDQGLLQVALDNLIRNAWKFTSRREHARIELGVTEENGERVYYVRDDGAGFDMAHAGKLFEAFQRLHGTTEFPGTGIGLAIVHRVILSHGGRIWAEGIVGEGATFFFTLSSAADESGEERA